MANVCPSRSSTSVSVRRVESAGTRKPSTRRRRCAKSSELTSGLTLRLIRSPPRTVGVKFRRTPNSLNMIVTELRAAAPACTTGYGNSPPARKLASLPLIAIRFGSARLWKRPLFCSARTTAPRPVLGVEDEEVQEVAEDQAACPVVEVRRGHCCGGAVRPDQLVLKPLAKKLAPSSCSALRLTSAKRTRQHHLVGGDAFLLLQQVDDVLLLLDVAAGDVGRLLDDVLARDGAGEDDVLAAADARDRLAREELLQLGRERGEVAADLDLDRS